MDDARTAPTTVLYVLAVAASVVTLATGIAVVMVAGATLSGARDGVLAAFVIIWVAALVYGSVIALPLACVGVPIIHRLCRDVESQSTQVAITGLVSLGLVLGIVGAVGTMDGSGGGAWVVGFLVGLPVAASTMVGRASVIPLVRRRQRATVRFERSNSQIRV